MVVFVFWAQNASQTGLLYSNESSRSEIQSAMTQFRARYEPIAEINFSEIYGNGGQFQILHPLLSFKKSHVSSCKNCSEKQLEAEEKIETSILESEKRRQLEAFLSGSSPLPNDFFLKPPFADQQGSSYAYLISMYPGLIGDQKKWLEQHLSYFKISELKEVLEKFKINDPKFLILSRFNEREIELVIRGEEVMLTSNYILFKDQDRLGFSPLSYSVYSVNEFNQFVKSGKFEVSTETDRSACMAKVGNSCWTYNSRQTQAYFYRYSFVILMLVGLFILSVFGFYIKSLYEKNKAQIKHRLSLQVLSHEFRTPVSAMLLMMEQLAQKQNNFDTESQDLIVRISTEIYRMQRIIEVSKTYLQTESHQIRFNHAEIRSINQWSLDFSSDFGKDISCEVLSEDSPLVVDQFWFKFILTNLVQNAFVHGKPPVKMKLQKSKNRLIILIQDQGHNEFNSIEDMTQAFVKSSRSKGMGLGLNMILFILDQWGARLSFSKDPTTFTVSLPLRGRV